MHDEIWEICPKYWGRVLLLCLQWTVCGCQAVQREELRHWVCSEVHQEAHQSGQQTGSEKRGDREGSGNPAAAPAPQHCCSAWRVREPHGCGADHGTVSAQCCERVNSSWQRSLMKTSRKTLLYDPKRSELKASEGVLRLWSKKVSADSWQTQISA